MNSSTRKHVAGVYATRGIAQYEDHPAMPALLKALPPRSAASLIRKIGVGDVTALMAMMPTRALLLTFDESIWKSPASGSAEKVDVDDLLEWLQAWSEIGEPFLLEKLAAMNEDYLTTLLSRIVTVESVSRYAVYGEVFDGFVDLVHDGRERFGPYIVEPTVEGEDIVREVVRSLWGADPERFFRIFGRMSDLPNPEDSTRGSTPTLHDIEFERESFREANGFVTADGARGFLAFVEGLTVAEIVALDKYDAETQRYLHAIERSSASAHDAPNPVMSDDLEEDQLNSQFAAVGSPSEEPGVAALRHLLEASQLLPKHDTLPLIQDMRHSNEPMLTAKLRLLGSENIENFHTCARELAYLANVLQWLPTDSDPLNDDDAKAAAFAICNLGLELAAGTRADKLDREPGLTRLFALGWKALISIRERAIGAFARGLSGDLTLAPWLLSEATYGLSDLRQAVERRRYVEAREASILLSIVFDSRICRAISTLLDAIPRFPAPVEDGGKSERSRWIATTTDLRSIERLLDSLRPKSRIQTRCGKHGSGP